MASEEIQVEEQVNAIIAKMEQEEQNPAQAAVERETQELPVTQAQEPAPETASDETAEGDTQEAQEPGEGSAIAPPPTWKADLKDAWTQLPTDLQRNLAQWEEERNRGVNGKLNEAAELRKAAEAEQNTAAQERQRYAQALDFYIQQAQNLDPILADGFRTDWATLARTDPASYVSKKAEFDQRLSTLQNAQAQRQAIAAQEEHNALQQRHTAIEAQMAIAAEKIPEWKEEATRTKFKQDLSNALKNDYGFTDAELQGLVDHRQLLICRDAMLYRQQQAAKQTLASKQVQTAPTKALRPGAVRNGNPANAHIKALKSTAMRSGKESDAIAAAMAIIGA